MKKSEEKLIRNRKNERKAHKFRLARWRIPGCESLASQVIDFAPKRAISALAIVQKESLVAAAVDG